MTLLQTLHYLLVLLPEGNQLLLPLLDLCVVLAHLHLRYLELLHYCLQLLLEPLDLERPLRQLAVQRLLRLGLLRQSLLVPQLNFEQLLPSGLPLLTEQLHLGLLVREQPLLLLEQLQKGSLLARGCHLLLLLKLLLGHHLRLLLLKLHHVPLEAVDGRFLLRDLLPLFVQLLRLEPNGLLLFCNKNFQLHTVIGLDVSRRWGVVA